MPSLAPHSSNMAEFDQSLCECLLERWDCEVLFLICFMQQPCFVLPRKSLHVISTSAPSGMVNIVVTRLRAQSKKGTWHHYLPLDSLHAFPTSGKHASAGKFWRPFLFPPSGQSMQRLHQTLSGRLIIPGPLCWTQRRGQKTYSRTLMIWRGFLKAHISWKRLQKLRPE